MVKERPESNSLGNKELDKAEKQFEKWEEDLKSLTLDRMRTAPKLETEPQVKLSTSELAKAEYIYLKPAKTIGGPDKFNEDYRSQWEFDKQIVNFIPENVENKGDRIELWTKPYSGVPAMFWVIPVGRPVAAPRFLNERIKNCQYHRLKMAEDNTYQQGEGKLQYYGQMAVDETINRLDTREVSTRTQFSMRVA